MDFINRSTSQANRVTLMDTKFHCVYKQLPVNIK